MNSDRMDLIETFLCIAQSDSLSQAAGKLNTTQATISRKLKKLEELLQQSLISRTTHSLYLTEAGKELLNEAQVLINQWNRIESRFKYYKAEPSDELHILTPPLMQRSPINKITLDFQQSHPDIKMIIAAGEPQEAASLNGYDVQLSLGPSRNLEQSDYTIASCDQTIVCAPEFVKSHSIHSVNCLERLSYVSLKSAAYTGLTVTSTFSDESQIIFPQNRKVASNHQSLYEAVCKGAGIGVLPTWCILEKLRTGKLVNIAPNWKPGKLAINASFNASGGTHQRAYAFVSYLSRQLSEFPGLSTCTKAAAL